jgi:hypothetical protein
MVGGENRDEFSYSSARSNLRVRKLVAGLISREWSYVHVNVNVRTWDLNFRATLAGLYV